MHHIQAQPDNSKDVTIKINQVPVYIQAVHSKVFERNLMTLIKYK